MSERSRTRPDMQVAVVIDFESMEFSPKGVTTGIIYWDIEGLQFPEAGWNDLVLVLVDSWLDAVIRLQRTQSCKEELRFMDGPFWVVLEATGESIEAVYVDGRFGESIRGRFQMQRRVMCNAVLRSARALCRYCRSISVTDDQITRINNSCDDLERMLSVLRGT